MGGVFGKLLVELKRESNYGYQSSVLTSLFTTP